MNDNLVYYSKSALVADINKKLAGENLSFAELQLYIDSTIDDINAALNSCYPSTSEMEKTWEIAQTDESPIDPATLPKAYADWNGYNTAGGVPYLTLFPINVVRRVIVLGAATKWLTADEEGINTAGTYETEYQKELYLLQRDFLNRVPPEYRASEQGFIHDSIKNPGITFYDAITQRTTTNTPYGYRDEI